MEDGVKKVGVIKTKSNGEKDFPRPARISRGHLQLWRGKHAAPGGGAALRAVGPGAAGAFAPHSPVSVSLVFRLVHPAGPRVPAAPGGRRPYRASPARHSGQRGAPSSASASTSSPPAP